MNGVLHFMEDGNFLCGYMGGGMVFEAETEEDVTCPDCLKVIKDRKLKKRMSLYDEEDD